MKKYILFSPLGMTDPIRGFRDGAMLHICRVYQPEKIYLYMTKEICDFDALDNRYELTLKKLAHSLGTTMEVHKIKREGVNNPHAFDAFYEEFNNNIRNIIGQNPDCSLIINLSSGTPQMKSALQTLCALSDRPYLPLQVTSPEGRSNVEATVKADYDVETEWELNLDNNKDTFINRCIEVTQKNYLAILQMEVIKKHVFSYNYSAALVAAAQIKGFINPLGYKLLQAANLRQSLNLKKLDALGLEGYKLHPVQSSDLKYIFEYLLILHLKLKKEELGDFIRGLSPVIADLFEICLAKVCRVDIRQRCERPGKIPFLVREKLKPEEVFALDEAFKVFPGGYKTGPLSSSNMLPLIIYYCRKFQAVDFSNKYSQIIDLTNKIRDFEKQCRNIVAHEIVEINDEWIKARTGFNASQLFAMLKQSFGLVCGQNLHSNIWNSYDDLNKAIVKELEIGTNDSRQSIEVY
jgi:CRISPR type III-A/MTUBE-associated protein Csm6